MALVQLRTGIKRRIQAILHRQGVSHDYCDLFGKGGRAFLTTLALSEACRAALDGWLAQIDLLDAQLAEVEAWVQQHLEDDELTRLLKTISGIGLILAHVIRAEVGQLTERFPNVDQPWRIRDRMTGTSRRWLLIVLGGLVGIASAAFALAMKSWLIQIGAPEWLAAVPIVVGALFVHWLVQVGK